ncbi:unnamed protein product [Effrenium voratum]|nr:unnamed protein product [Effrenium voratum]
MADEAALIRAEEEASKVWPEPVVVTAHLPPSSYEASSSSNTVGENQLLAIMLACSSHRPSTANERDAMRAFHELRSFASGCKVELNALTALQLAAFMRAHKAPTRAYNALFWMNKNLKLVYDTSLLIKPAKKSAPTKFGGCMWFVSPTSRDPCFDLNAMMPLKIQLHPRSSWVVAGRHCVPFSALYSLLLLLRLQLTWSRWTSLLWIRQILLRQMTLTSSLIVWLERAGLAQGTAGMPNRLPWCTGDNTVPETCGWAVCPCSSDEAFLKRQRISFVGESALIHCKAGVHRAPMLTAVILGILDDLTLDSALAKIGEVRAIEPEKVQRTTPRKKLLALVHGRKFCYACSLALPASDILMIEHLLREPCLGGAACPVPFVSMLPCDDLLGREVRSAELSVEELRFFVEMLKARPREAQGDVLNLQPRFAQLDASHGRALGCWLRSFQGALGLAECRGLLGPALLQGLANTPLRLRKLDLCACGVSPEHLAALLQNARLEELNLSFNELTFEAFEGLARSDCRVSKLVLKHCDLSAQSLPLSALSCLQLAELDLRWNPRLGLTSGDLQALGLQRLRLGRADPEALAEPKRSCLPHLMRHAELREMLRALVPEPLEWRALQLAATWAEVGRPLQEVHRRPGLRAQCRRLRVRLRGLDRRDLLAGAKRPLEDLRFAVELLGARPRSAPADRPLCRIQQLDLGRAPLPAGGRAEGTAQAAALGVFLRSCSQLSELRLEGSAHLCTPAALDAITVSLGDLRLPLRALLFGGCSVSSEAAAPLGRLLRRCPRLARLSLAGARRLGPGLGTLAEAWARGETLAVEELVFSNCGLDESSAPALGQLLRQCQRLVHLVLDGNKALFRAPSLVGLLRGLGDEGLPELRSLVAYDLAVMDEAAAEAFDRFVNRCSALRGEVAAGGL